MTAKQRRLPSEWGSRTTSNDNRSIERRILDALIWVVHVRGWKPYRIYLTETDLALLPAENRFVMSIGGLEVRVGKRSVLYADCWRAKKI